MKTDNFDPKNNSVCTEFFVSFPFVINSAILFHQLANLELNCFTRLRTGVCVCGLCFLLFGYITH